MEVSLLQYIELQRNPSGRYSFWILSFPTLNFRFHGPLFRCPWEPGTDVALLLAGDAAWNRRAQYQRSLTIQLSTDTIQSHNVESVVRLVHSDSRE